MLLPRENTFRAFRQLFREHLQDMYEPEEVDALFRISIEEKLSISWSHTLLNGRFNESDINRLSPILEGLMEGRPLQYLLGHTNFLGCRIGVDNRVLIPRPETEELCELVLRENPKESSLNVLDVGTGSGCIPIALKKYAPRWHLSALDVASGALQLAAANAQQNNAEISFHQIDILSVAELPARYDLIVSNPPYVAEQEKLDILDNVLVHEPHLALFVPDTDTMLFYRKIACLAATALVSGGKLYFEINERFGSETIAEMIETGLRNCRVLQDLSGKDRFAVGEV